MILNIQFAQGFGETLFSGGGRPSTEKIGGGGGGHNLLIGYLRGSD